MTEEWVPTGIDLSKPSPARIYDYTLGGKDNFAVDREVGDKVFTLVPEIRQEAHANRGFLARAVRFLATEAGIRQFIDIGTGIPTQGNTHEIAHEATSDARVVYVDNDPMVLAHSRALLADSGPTAVVQADMRRPEDIINHSSLTKLIDFDQPVAVMFVASLHLITDADGPGGIVARFREKMAPGSYLVISHLSQDAMPEEAADRFVHAFDNASAQMVLRSKEEIRGLCRGFEFVEPGLVTVTGWRPSAPADGDDPSLAMAGVARKV